MSRLIALPLGVDHGTRMAYKLGCRCLECEAGHATRMREYRHRRARMGGTTMVPADKARSHVLALKEQGHRDNGIAAAAGACPNQIAKLATGKLARIRQDFEERILAVTSTPRCGNYQTPIAQVRRIYAACLSRGVTLDSLASECGYASSRSLPRRRQGFVYTATLTRIEAAAARLGVTVADSWVRLSLPERVQSGVLDEATQRALSRARDGRSLTLPVAQRLCSELGLELADVVA